MNSLREYNWISPTLYWKQIGSIHNTRHLWKKRTHQINSFWYCLVSLFSLYFFSFNLFFLRSSFSFCYFVYYEKLRACNNATQEFHIFYNIYNVEKIKWNYLKTNKNPNYSHEKTHKCLNEWIILVAILYNSACVLSGRMYSQKYAVTAACELSGQWRQHVTHSTIFPFLVVHTHLRSTE